MDLASSNILKSDLSLSYVFQEPFPVSKRLECFNFAGLQSTKQHVVQNWPPQTLCDAEAFERKHHLWVWSKSRDHVLHCRSAVV